MRGSLGTEKKDIYANQVDVPLWTIDIVGTSMVEGANEIPVVTNPMLIAVMDL